MKYKLLIVAATAALTLAAAAPALADENHVSAQADVSQSANMQDKGGFNLGSFIGAHLGFDQKDGDKDGTSTNKDNDNDGHHVATSTIMKVHPNVAVGVVTSVTGSGFTIDPFGPKSTTTVTTGSATVYKAKGGATTSASLAVGQRVIVVGTTTATSTTGDSITASLVALIGKGLGHLRFWMWFR